MPQVSRPDGAVIHYEVTGSGYPLLLIAPGGVSSQVEVWQRSAINPIAVFSSDFMVVAMDQRHAGRSKGPMKPFSYADAAADQVAVLDHLGVDRAHVMGGCIGVAYLLRLIHDAPTRISAGVGQDPVGLDTTNSMDTFYAMFHETVRLARSEGLEAVVKAAEENAFFMLNNGAGPFSQWLHDDPGLRQELLDMGRERYVNLIVRFRDGMWPPNPPYFTVSEEWVRSCPAPLLIIPGNDPFHPTSVGRKICAEAPKARCLDVDARSPEKLPATIETIRSFLIEHTPA